MKNSRVLQCKQQVYDLKPIRIILLTVYYKIAFIQNRMQTLQMRFNYDFLTW